MKRISPSSHLFSFRRELDRDIELDSEISLEFDLSEDSFLRCTKITPETTELPEVITKCLARGWETLDLDEQRDIANVTDPEHVLSCLLKAGGGLRYIAESIFEKPKIEPSRSKTKRAEIRKFQNQISALFQIRRQKEFVLRAESNNEFNKWFVDPMQWGCQFDTAPLAAEYAVLLMPNEDQWPLDKIPYSALSRYFGFFGLQLKRPLSTELPERKATLRQEGLAIAKAILEAQLSTIPEVSSYILDQYTGAFHGKDISQALRNRDTKSPKILKMPQLS